MQEPQHSSYALDKHRSEVPIATFGNSSQPHFSAAAVLSRCQTHPGSKLPTISKLLRVGHGTDQGSGNHWADTGHRGKKLTVLSLCKHCLQQFIELSKPAIEGGDVLQVKCAQASHYWSDR